MHILANFVQKVNFKWTQFQRVGLALAEFYLFEFSSLRVLEESCFKTSKVPLHEYLTIEFFIFASFVQKVDFELSQFQKVSVALADFLFFCCVYCGYKGKVVLKLQKLLLSKRFYDWNVDLCICLFILLTLYLMLVH